MDAITKAIELLESKYLEEDIRKLTPKDRINIYLNIKEFNQPKIQRSNFEPSTDNEINIIITKDYAED